VARQPRQELEKLLYDMILIRRFEEKAAEMYARGKIKGFLHLYIGQEAVAAGVFSKLQPRDYIYTHYREHGHALARGMSASAIMAELYGKKTGVSGGLGGSMHLFDVAKRFMGGYAIVGGHMPLACGTAMAVRRRGEDAAVLCIIGDGAVNEGAFHETLNLAAIWKLPVLFLLENNGYGMGTPVEKVCAFPDIYKHAEVYGIRAAKADGMNVVEMQHATEEALQYVRSGEGAFFLEAMTYRFRGHSMADPESYRDKAEVEYWRKNLDPITTFMEAIAGSGQVSQADIDAIWERVEREVEEAVQFAEDSPFPAVEHLLDNMYAPSPLDELMSGGGA
jgi:pyruvate dehydrogenase E1 component alpha subunit